MLPAKNTPIEVGFAFGEEHSESMCVVIIQELEVRIVPRQADILD